MLVCSWCVESMCERVIPCRLEAAGVNIVKLEKHKILVVVLFSVMVGIFAFSCIHDPYAEKRSQDDLMSLILSRIGLDNVFGGF